MHHLQRNLNALAIVIICGVLLGALGVQFFLHEEPCPLCLLQRLGMVGVASSLLLNIQFGIRASHYALGLISCLVGGTVALRQVSLHVCPSFAQFGSPVFGVSLYTWSFFVFAASVLGIALLLFCYKPDRDSEEREPLNGWSWFAFSLILLIVVVNVVATFFQCGIGPCQD